MALLDLGIAVDAEYLRPAIDYLATLNITGIDPYWRIELLALTHEYMETVVSDAQSAMALLREESNLPQRLWPLPYFLLRFLNRHPELRQHVDFSSGELIQAILNEFSPDSGCRKDASLTSMAMAELSRVTFPEREVVLRQMTTYLLSRRAQFNLPYRRPGFELNHLRDFYLITCLTYYPDFYRRYLNAGLHEHIDLMAESTFQIASGDHWNAVPAYGGKVGSHVSPTAFGVRALLSYYSIKHTHFRRDVLADTLDLMMRRDSPHFSGAVLSAAAEKDQEVVDSVDVIEHTPFRNLEEWLIGFRDHILTLSGIANEAKMELTWLVQGLLSQLASSDRDRGSMRMALHRIEQIGLRVAGEAHVDNVIVQLNELSEIRDLMGL